MSNEPSVKSFTVKAPHIVHEILTSVEISKPAILDEPSDNLIKIQTKALWDTGATHCAITKNAAEKAGLVPSSMVMVAHAGGISYKNVFLVDMHLPNKVTLET